MNTKINSLVRAKNIIKLLSQGVNSFSEIVNILGMKKSTVHGLIKTLEYEGFVIQDPRNRKYYLGPFILELGSNPYMLHQHLISLSYKQIEFLRDQTNETVILNILLGTDVFALEVIPSKQDIAYYTAKGSSIPAYIGSGARALLSQLDDNDVDTIIKSLTFIPLTHKTITDKSVFAKQVKQARKDGYFITYGEKTDDSFGISVPIRNYLCPASLTVLGPEYRLKGKSQDILPKLKNIADNISNSLSTQNT